MTSNLIEEKISFSTFCNTNSLDPRLTKACTQKLGYSSPTLVQAKAVPLALAGRDLLVRARTGSGKTAAYGLVLLQKILIAKSSENVKSRGGGVRALILVPTRELVDQTTQALSEMASFCTDCVSIFALGGAAAASGGIGTSTSTKSKAAISADAARLVAELPDVIVSTPFRMAAVLSSGSAKNGDTINGLLKTLCDTLIVDEADLVLSFGYEADMRTCIAALPRIRQSMLLSATLSPELDELRKLVLHSPAILKLHEETTARTSSSGTKNGVGEGNGVEGGGGGGGGYAHGTSGILTQFYVRVPRIDRFLLLYSLLKLRLLSGKTLIFTNSVSTCFKLKLFLERFSISAAVLNAELPANSRQNIINQFNKGLFDLLIATDEGVAEDAPQEEEVGEEEEGVEKEKKSTDGVFDASADIDDASMTAISAGLKRKRGKSTKKEVQKSGKRSKSAQLLGQLKDSEYGVSRGVDFRAVTTVVNFDFPVSASSYIHRVGRTARGGLAGVALSLVAPEGVEEKQDVVLKELFKVLPPAPGTGFPQPSPLPFNIGEIEGFRYRVEDVLQSVTDGQIKEARLTELRREILASQALRAHFEDNPRDLAVLQHEKALNPQKVKTHLRAVPTYLLPPSLRAAAEAAGGGISSGKGGKGGKGGKRGRNAPRNEDSSNKGHGEMDASSTSDTRDTTRSAVYSASKSSAVDPLKSFAISQDKAASIAGKIKASLASGGGGGGGGGGRRG
jgi:ATP-dependent RNA helicase DDX56/DBP9